MVVIYYLSLFSVLRRIYKTSVNVRFFTVGETSEQSEMLDVTTDSRRNNNRDRGSSLKDGDNERIYPRGREISCMYPFFTAGAT